jgi:hypothetical protein
MRRRSACRVATCGGVMSWVQLPKDYYEGYALMNQDEDIVDYTQFWDIALRWYEYGASGRKIAKIIIYDMEDPT